MYIIILNAKCDDKPVSEDELFLNYRYRGQMKVSVLFA